MRIISGSLRGRRLATPPEGDTRVRPTADRAREALFSILQKWPTGPFLDLYAGTGAVGLEAWSRGYAPVTCVEQGEPGWSCLQANAKGTDLVPLRKDARKLAPEAFRDQAVLFMDPPYAEAEAAWKDLAGRLRGWIAPGGVLVVETDSETSLELQPGWQLADIRQYGAPRFHFWIPV
jgi:16S rRNA (guanine966-N2)-methyltransferase